MRRPGRRFLLALLVLPLSPSCADPAPGPPEGDDLGRLIAAAAKTELENVAVLGCASPPEDLDVVQVFGTAVGNPATVSFTGITTPIDDGARRAVIAELRPRVVRFVEPPTGGLPTSEGETILAMSQPQAHGNSSTFEAIVLSSSGCENRVGGRYARSDDGTWEFAPLPSSSD